MAKLHFFYSSMNAGKSTSLLQSNHNFEENKLSTLLFLPQMQTNKNELFINSRIGIKRKAIIADISFNFYNYIKKNNTKKLKCVFIDEAQFLKKNQVEQLAKIADDLDITVMCYGLRTDYMGELFEGSLRLLSIADNFHELKTICSFCTNKATMTLRMDEDSYVHTNADATDTNNKDLYKPVCRKHFTKLTKLM
ncbi:thymidine kinase [Gammaproteobacteria bacterium]|nr:thymidine kinase [Gammaproteobacteria bacterium]MDC1074519.1 thymidine kinase [Gammaproteobacteria bacterium]